MLVTSTRSPPTCAARLPHALVDATTLIFDELAADVDVEFVLQAAIVRRTANATVRT
jgi:hypothetical protein